MEKQLMLGNDAIARGVYEAGGTVVSSYPGTPSTEITECLSKYSEIYSEWAPNEKVAAEVALGASIAGARAFTAMKHVGLNVAADPIFTAAYSGINGGLVIAVADDPGMHSSQNEQDSRNYAKAAKIPMLEPSNSAECKEFTKLAFRLSEDFDTPVFLRLTTRISHSQSAVEQSGRLEPGLREYKKDASKYVMTPANARVKHPILEEKLEKLQKWAEDCEINSTEINGTEIGIITSGICYNYARETFGEKASYLKLGMIHPLPVNLIREFADKFEKVYVIEELDDFIETHCLKNKIQVIGKELLPLVGEFSQKLLREKILGETPKFHKLQESLPIRPPVMCAGCPHRGVFYILGKLGVTVSGDIGCYTLGASPPLNAADTTICMGASVSALHGFNMARPDSVCKSVAVIGDSTFMHSGITGLIDIAYNQGKSTVIVLDNSITGMTGHQDNPTTGKTIKGSPVPKISIEKICEACGMSRVQIIDPSNLEEIETAIKEHLALDAPSVIIARKPCALLKEVKHNPPYNIDKELCRNCKKCLKIGCPAISIKDHKAVIEKTLCVGCGLCEQMCPFEAISGGDK